MTTRRLLHEAVQEAEEARSWVCLDCPRMIEEGREGASRCRYCQEYRDDCAAGLWSDERA